MPTEVQPGIAIKYTAGEDADDAEGKVVVYSDVEDEVVIGMEGDTKFAGVIISITGARSESTAIGVVSMNEGDNIGVVNDGIMEVRAAVGEVINFGEAIAIADDGFVKALPDVDSSSVDPEEIMQMIGRAQEDVNASTASVVFKALIYARK